MDVVGDAGAVRGIRRDGLGGGDPAVAGGPSEAAAATVEEEEEEEGGGGDDDGFRWMGGRNNQPKVSLRVGL